jgi:predicted HTH domain antitoxin
MDLTLKIPSAIHRAIRLPEQQQQIILLRELALVLYQQNILSFGKARELAQMSKWEFHEMLGARNIERHYSLENYQEDLKYANS